MAVRFNNNEEDRIMNDENKFWLALWRLVAGCFCILIVSISSCIGHANYKSAKIIESGRSAVEAKCAVYNGSEGTEAACAMAGSKYNQSRSEP